MENRKETLARVLRFAKPYRWYLLAALVSAVLSVSLTLYAPVLIGRGIDQIIAPGKVYFDNLLPILIELGIVAVLAAIFQWLLTLCTNIVTYKTVRDLRSAAFEHMEELPLSTSTAARTATSSAASSTTSTRFRTGCFKAFPSCSPESSPLPSRWCICWQSISRWVW